MTLCKAARPVNTLLLMIALQTYYGHAQINNCGSVAKIIDSPEGIIAVEVNSTITFTCRGNGSSISWNINSTLTVTDNDTGITVPLGQYADCIAKRNMTVFASPERNNSNITCTIRRNSRVSSKPAYLIVVGPPLPPGPMLNVLNASSLQVSWTKPYSWPEYNILYYKIVVYSDGKSFRSADINGTDSEYIFLAERCIEFTIFLSAINSVGESEAATITGSLPIVLNQHYVPPINVAIHFQSDGTSSIEITFPLPIMCHYRDINFTIILRNPANIVLDTGPKQYSHADQHMSMDPPLVHEVIQSRLEVNTAYSVSVMVSTPVGIFYSNETTIFTSGSIDKEPMLNIIAVAVGSAAAVIALLVAASTTAVIVVKCIHKHKRDDQDHSTEKVQSAMIPNPIYEGPLYETISPQNFDPLAANVENDTSQERESRYLDTPILPAKSGKVVVQNTGITSVADPAGTGSDDNYTLMSPIGSKMIIKN